MLSIASQPSIFPLYRRITSLLHTKFIQLTLQTDKPWAHLITALFALATLCRLHNLQDSTNYTFNGIAPLGGQEAILNAFVHFDTSNK